MLPRSTNSTLFPYTTLFRSTPATQAIMESRYGSRASVKFIPTNFYQEFFIKDVQIQLFSAGHVLGSAQVLMVDRKSTRLNSSHVRISYAVFCLKKKKKRLTH